MAYKLYKYDPSGAAAIPVAALFGLATVIHIVQMIRARSWFMIPFTIGGVCELLFILLKLHLVNISISSPQSRQSVICADTSIQRKRQTGKLRPISDRASLFFSPLPFSLPLFT
jgi:hypothetical protein